MASSDGDGSGAAAILGVVHAHCSGGELIVVEIGIAGGGRKHHGVGAAAGTAGGNQIVRTAWQIAQQDVVLNETGSVFLVPPAA